MRCPLKGCPDAVLEGHILCRSHWFVLPPKRRAELRELAREDGPTPAIARMAAVEASARVLAGVRGPFGEGRPAPVRV